MPKIRRALLSVSEKTGLVELAKELVQMGVQVLSTGGTSKLLRESGLPIVEVSDYTGQPEILDGRLKTLHPKIHGAILAKRSEKRHLEELKRSEIETIDMVVVNLYPFEETVKRTGVTLEEAIEQIDIGGPTMLRAAAKNWQDVTVICDPSDYGTILCEMEARAGEVSQETNFRLARKVFLRTARYESAISHYLSLLSEESFPKNLFVEWEKVQDLRYGENPHQKGAFYRERDVTASDPCVVNAVQIHGKELSFNNILDLDAAIELVKEFEEPACVIVKHSNPCGVATLTRPSTSLGAPSPLRAFRLNEPEVAREEGFAVKDIFCMARSCDFLSAFGGIIAMNREIDRETAEEIARDFYECVIAPGYDPKGREILARKKNIRLMELPSLRETIQFPKGHDPRGHDPRGHDLKRVGGGLLVQDPDLSGFDVRKGKVVSERKPTEAEWAALSFAWKVVKHVKSNAIVIAGVSPLPSAGEGLGVRATLGIGAGQMSRVDAVKLAIAKMTSPLPAALASDAFFPFRDNVDEAAKAGVTAIIQPGGSIKDKESIDAANEHKMAMVFTGVRHFRH